MSSTTPKQKTTTMQFVGAAQKRFRSFTELARFMLDTYWINWNNPSNPTSYISPPTYPFLNKDKSDGDIKAEKIILEEKKNEGQASKPVLSSMERPIIDRWSNQGEFEVFQALWKLVERKIHAPFVAVHSLNLNKFKDQLQEFFPQANCVFKDEFKSMMREFDFVVIGPNIGIIVIEVKSSSFTKGKDFSQRQSNLPEQIIDGIEQLQSFDHGFFQACFGIQDPPKIGIRRILFTPNLEKKRYETWYNKLNDQAKEKVKKSLESNGKGTEIIHWFKEDLISSVDDASKTALYNRIRHLIESREFQIPQMVYEAYAPIICGLGSAVIFKNQTNTTLSIEPLLTSTAILEDAAALESQNLKIQKLSLDSTEPKRPKLEVVQLHANNKLVLLTPDQRKTLNGPNRQFILGAPGTGKSIILQAKALQLLDKGKKVLVDSQMSFAGKYRELFQSHGCTNFEITTDFLIEILKSISVPEEFVDTTVPDISALLSKIRGILSEEKDYPVIHNCLSEFDAILIDDVFDGPGWDHFDEEKRVLSELLLMKSAKSPKFDSKIVWIAADAFLPNEYLGLHREQMTQIIQTELRDYFDLSDLNRVMRSSESVFQTIYSQEILQYFAIKPTLGHKIHGFSNAIRFSYLEIDQAMSCIWKHVEDQVKKFRQEGFEYGHMAVIVERAEENRLWTFLCAKFEENGIPIARGNTQSLTTLAVDKTGEVASLEWPIVVYAAIDKGKKGDFDRYWACSRATMKVVEIIATKAEQLEELEKMHKK